MVALRVVQGLLHGLLLNTPYVTKDHLQLKRFQAQNNDTTYVYDYPEMFKQALERLWNNHAKVSGEQWRGEEREWSIVVCVCVCVCVCAQIVRKPG